MKKGQAGRSGGLEGPWGVLSVFQGGSERRMGGWLFAYGTLAPESSEEAARGGWEPDAVQGTLHDLGSYPALTAVGNPDAGWVEGYVRPLEERRVLESLDRYEGVEEGLFQRVSARTREGRRVWVYVYGRRLPLEARGPITRWTGARLKWLSGEEWNRADGESRDRSGRGLAFSRVSTGHEQRR
ncbi:MAG: hypothetical protein NVSMB9_28960 [Isosphaeraceae bacterium]